MELAGKVGMAAALIGLAVILIELALIVPRALRLNRQLALFVEAVDAARTAIESDLAQFDAAGRETHLLWKPYRRTLRWMTHPLTVALFASYRRRRSGNGFGRQGNQASPIDRVAG